MIGNIVFRDGVTFKAQYVSLSVEYRCPNAGLFRRSDGLPKQP